MVRRLVTLLLPLIVVSGCLYDAVGDGDFVGVIVNDSSYTLDIDDPLDAKRYYHLRPQERTVNIALDERSHTFTARYAVDGAPYASVTFYVNAVTDDALIGDETFDWAVIFQDPSRYAGNVRYHP